MKVFLKLKHWQIFLTWIITSILYVSTIFTHIWFITVAVYAFAFIGYIYSTGKVINELNAENKIEDYHEDLWFILSLIMVLPFVYFFHTAKIESGFFVFGALFCEGFPAIKLVNFSAKSIGQYEQKKSLKFSGYASNFLRLMFLPLSIWRLQPRMNKIAKEI